MTDDSTLGAYNIFDLRDIAVRRVPKGLFEFVDRGAEDEDLKLLDTARAAEG